MLRHVGDASKVGIMLIARGEGFRGYVTPVTAKVVTAGYYELIIINQVWNLSTYARQLAAFKYFIKTRRVRGPPCSHINVVFRQRYLPSASVPSVP